MPDPTALATAANPPQPQRAGLVIIGNEVLSAKVRDSNTPLLLDKLAAAGVQVAEVAMLPDEPPRIAAVVRAFAQQFDLVVTTGGVGPTHDDCTWRAVADALDAPLEPHLELIALLERRLRQPLSPEQLRLANLPRGTELVGQDGRWPMLRLRNVYVLPGVPSLVAARIDQICDLHRGPRPWLATVYLDVDEFAVVADIDAVVADFADLAIGSYPIFEPADHRLRLTFEGFDRDRVVAAVDAMAGRMATTPPVRVVWQGGDLPASESAKAGPWPR